jgi:hypothetical protein
MSKQTEPSIVFAQSVGDANGQMSLQTSAEFARTYNAHVHEITNAITAVVLHAHTGLNLLRAQSPDLEKVRQALNGIANGGKRAGDFVVRTRALMKTVAAADGATDP